MSRPSLRAHCARAATLVLGITLATALLTMLTVPAAPPATARPDAPSEEKVEQSKEKAEKRAEAVDRIEAKLAEARQQLDPLTAKIDRLVAKFYEEQAQLQRAKRGYRSAQQRLAEAEHRLRETEDSVDALAAQRYRNGGSLQHIGAMLKAEGPQDLADRMAGLRVIAREREAKLDRMHAAQIVADVVRQRAKEALTAQKTSTEKVEQAKAAAQKAARQQRAEIEQIQQLQAQLESKLADARARSDRLEQERKDYLDWRAQKRARERAARKAREAREAREARKAREAQEAQEAQDGQETSEKQQVARDEAQDSQQAAAEATQQIAETTSSDCADKPVSLGSYANGLIPPQALCALPQDGHMLRADAAAAFMRLNAAYADHFGEPICITDSYRTLAVQQRLAQEKPGLAAEPGTSNHGKGTALDLCGGINSFGTTTHEWMLAHAPEYGWDSPEWARPDGSMPEPWHWEFTG